MPVVVDASAGVEIIVGTRHGRALTRLLPAGAEGWVPEHFYAEVLAILRRRVVVDRTITEAQGATAVRRLSDWHLHKGSLRSFQPLGYSGTT